MRKKFLYAGASLLIIGLAFLIVGETVFKGTSYVEVPGGTEDSWELSGNLENGKTYMLLIESGDEWGEPFRTGDINTPTPINVTITSPCGNFTKLQVYFYGLQPTNPYYKVNLAIVSVDYLIVDEDCLTVTELSSQIRFTVRRNGVYNVSILRQGLAETAPLSMAFYEEIMLDRNVYHTLVLSGGSICLVGVLTSVWGFTGKKRVYRRKRS